MGRMTEHADLFRATVITGGINTSTTQIVFGIENAGRCYLHRCNQNHGTTEHHSVETHNLTRVQLKQQYSSEMTM